MGYICPVCGYNGLTEVPYDKDGNPSYEVCDCCGYEFGFDDSSEGISFDEYRNQWLDEGTKWFNPNLKPENWKLRQQLLRIGIKL